MGNSGIASFPTPLPVGTPIGVSVFFQGFTFDPDSFGTRSTPGLEFTTSFQ